MRLQAKRRLNCTPDCTLATRRWSADSVTQATLRRNPIRNNSVSEPASILASLGISRTKQPSSQNLATVLDFLLRQLHHRFNINLTLRFILSMVAYILTTYICRRSIGHSILDGTAREISLCPPQCETETTHW